MAQPTLEQQRAQNAWDSAAGCGPEYANLAKSLPALIMGSGLMQVIAFLHSKSDKSDEHRKLSRHLLAWLNSRFPRSAPADFEEFMKSMFEAPSADYQLVTSEALAWLKWLRQMASIRREN